MARTIPAKQPTPAETAVMLSNMSKENYEALTRIIIQVYGADKEARRNEKETRSRKKQAFLKMEELKKNARKYYDPDFDAQKERAEALEEKYGRFD